MSEGSKIAISVAAYFAVAAFTFGWLSHRDGETCLPAPNAYNARADYQACAASLGALWPIYWPYRIAFVALRP